MIKAVKTFTTGSYASRIMRVVEARGKDKTACPSEVLPAHLKKSKILMQKVRDVAQRLATEGKIEILQSGRAIKKDAKGPIRLRIR